MLKDISLFSCLDADALRSLEAVAVRKKFPKNAVVFLQEDESDSVYIILSGRVKAVIHDEQGREIVLAMIGAGEYFGEMAALDGVPRSATVMTTEPTKMLVIHRDDFKHFLSAHPDLVFNLLKVLLARLRKADQTIENLALKNVHGRVANLLMQFAVPSDGKWVLKKRMTHQEIANMVGSSREMVSKIMGEFAHAGLITIEKKQITIHKKLV